MGGFFGASAIPYSDAMGGAIAPNGVYAKILSGHSFLSASEGLSITYYEAASDSWIYGKAKINCCPAICTSVPGRNTGVVEV